MSKPDANANSHASQHQGFEVFWHDKALPGWNNWPYGGEGWYWWSCQPGEPVGPFNTSVEAWRDCVYGEEAYGDET